MKSDNACMSALSKAGEALTKQQYSIVFKSLRETIRNLQRLNPDLSRHYLDMLDKLREDYFRMLEYGVTGNPDPGRDSLIAEISADLAGLTGELEANIENHDSSEKYYSNRRIVEYTKASFESKAIEYVGLHDRLTSDAELDKGERNALQKEKDALLADIFNSVWALPYGSKNALKQIELICGDSRQDFVLKSQIISALMLATLQIFDRHKLMTLCRIFAANEEARLSARLITAIVIILKTYGEKVAQDERIKNILDSWQDSLITYTRVRDAVMAFIRTTDTNRINDRMKSDILPSLNQLRPDLVKAMRDKFGSLSPEDIDMNPEWEDLLRSSGLEEKIREIAEMQNEGADVLMMPFSQLKRFPFFNTVSNWFLPFYIENSSLSMLATDDSAFFRNILTMENGFCDSDKYSLAFALNTMPRMNRDMLKGQLDAALSQLKDELEDKKLKDVHPEFSSELSKYMRDLYRFFNLYPDMKAYPGPFDHPITFSHIQAIPQLVNDPDSLKLISEFYLRRGYMKEALGFLEFLSEQPDCDIHVWEKIGWCRMSLGDSDGALTDFRKADLFFPDNPWIIKRMALCLSACRQYSEAAECYSRLLEKDPDNIRLLTKTSRALFADNKYDESLKLAYKANYLMPDDREAIGLISVGEALRGDVEKARDFCFRMRNIEKGFDPSEQAAIEAMVSLISSDITVFSNLINQRGVIAILRSQLHSLNLYDRYRHLLYMAEEYARMKKFS